MADWKTLKKEIDDELNKKNATLSQVDLDKLIDFAYSFVTETDLKFVKIHQIRRFFDAVKNIKLSVDSTKDSTKSFDKKEKAKLLMLRPQLFNASKKQWTLKELSNITGEWIKKVNDKDDFYQFANFFESLVAFHKAEAKE